MRVEQLKIVIIVVGALFLVALGGYVFLTQRTVMPTFAEYSVDDIYTGDPAPVDFETHQSAKQFRTRITQAAKEGPNFAGRYTIAEWGCGTNCSVAAVIDAETGAIIEYGLVSTFGFAYRLDSNLLVVNPPEDVVYEVYKDTVTTYFKMENGNLKRIVSFGEGEEGRRYSGFWGQLLFGVS